MKGHAETMLLRIVENLDWEWQHWIEWPISMIFGADLIDESIVGELPNGDFLND